MSYINESIQQKQPALFIRSPTESSILMNNSFSSNYSAPNSPNSTVNSSNTQKNNSFSSNLCTVLNDPRKDRNKINYLFTKTWGSDFVDTVTIHPISNYKNFKLKDFEEYLNDIKEKNLRHTKNKQDLINSSSNKNDSNLIELAIKQQKQSQLLDLDKIPKIFFDPNFSLTDKNTFNSIISSKLFDSSDTQTAIKPLNPFLLENNNNETQAYKEALDKLSIYLDITETHISRQVSTKANTFFNAIHSQDEVQEHVFKTCTAVKNLRKNVKFLDQNVIIKSLRVIKLVQLRIKLMNLLEKLELMSSVYETQPTIQLHLSSSEFTGALDLIAMSQDILRQDLRGIRSMRHYDSQFVEIEKAIDKILHQEFTKYIVSDLSRSFNQGVEVLNQEKLCSLMLGILRIKSSNFVDLCKEEILIYIKSTIKQTVIEYITQLDDDSLNSNDDDTTNSLIDRVKPLKIQEFLHLLSKVLANTKTMLNRVLSLIKVIKSVVDSAAGLKQDEITKEGSEIINDTPNIIISKELINKTVHSKLVTGLRELITNASDYAQERLVNLLEGKFSLNTSSQTSGKENVNQNNSMLNNINNNNHGLEKLSSNDFISLSNLIDQFIIDFDQIAYNNTINNNMNKKSSSLRIWLQNQANKFLHKFHSEKKDKLTLALNSERWKQIEIPIEIQNLVDHIIKNGLGNNQVLTKKNDLKSNSTSNGDYVIVNNEKYVIFGTVIVLIKLMVEYSQYVIDIPTMSFDALNRIIELFKTFNAKSYQMILGAGAVDQKVLKLITFKTLALTYRSLELILVLLPVLKDFFRDRIPQDKQPNLEKLFNQLTKDYNEHKLELNNKLIFMIDDIFRELLSKYEVIAPVPSQCFRSICQQLLRIHEITSEIFNDSTLVKMFTEIHSKFKQRLGDRLKELNVVNDGGPQHALIFSDMSYYIKQFKGLNGLHLISINFEDVWAM